MFNRCGFFSQSVVDLKKKFSAASSSSSFNGGPLPPIASSTARMGKGKEKLKRGDGLMLEKLLFGLVGHI